MIMKMTYWQFRGLMFVTQQQHAWCCGTDLNIVNQSTNSTWNKIEKNLDKRK